MSIHHQIRSEKQLSTINTYQEVGERVLSMRWYLNKRAVASTITDGLAGPILSEPCSWSHLIRCRCLAHKTSLSIFQTAYLVSFVFPYICPGASARGGDSPLTDRPTCNGHRILANTAKGR